MDPKNQKLFTEKDFSGKWGIESEFCDENHYSSVILLKSLLEEKDHQNIIIQEAFYRNEKLFKLNEKTYQKDINLLKLDLKSKEKQIEDLDNNKNEMK